MFAKSEQTGDDLVQQHAAAVQQYDQACVAIEDAAKQRRAVVRARLASLEAEERTLKNLCTRLGA